ncbi:ectoine/hydroxyectoine ABC transporter permease subunit EhuC [Desulfosporosinus youngiae]|uniref:Ectoine/hydroxyectoine ABC transporter, permease protein EhuC n=1 Tax=Desulfosporosinus youngiae DSM 17734 TaxID=768710 RepID=H5XUZ0_9FIRM|nr:ectoine/hydroxyectoine ABC transporter permease subunit EhuC [Desulfosporosinus youngiae]EHQ89442.1 ectoine/hydroxyectoine ABC transporter, permease protein EhuC [Desulfosporosinus youngiae DSM 17734]
MSQPFDILPILLRGAGITIELTLVSAVLAFGVSFLVGFGRLAKFKLIRIIAGVYTEFFRGTSLLVQLFWVYFVLPLFNVNLTAMQAGILILGLHFGAYGSEVVRSSILAVPKGQTETGIVLNMKPRQILWRIILPQAFLIMIPTFGNYLIELLKATAIVSLITLNDLMFQASMLQNTTLRTTEVFGMVLLIYFCLAYPLTLGVRWVERKISVGRA